MVKNNKTDLLQEVPNLTEEEYKQAAMPSPSSQCLEQCGKTEVEPLVTVS